MKPYLHLNFNLSTERAGRFSKEMFSWMKLQCHWWTGLGASLDQPAKSNRYCWRNYFLCGWVTVYCRWLFQPYCGTMFTINKVSCSIINYRFSLNSLFYTSNFLQLSPSRKAIPRLTFGFWSSPVSSLLDLPVLLLVHLCHCSYKHSTETWNVQNTFYNNRYRQGSTYSATVLKDRDCLCIIDMHLYGYVKNIFKIRTLHSMPWGTEQISLSEHCHSKHNGRRPSGPQVNECIKIGHKLYNRYFYTSCFLGFRVGFLAHTLMQNLQWKS